MKQVAGIIVKMRKLIMILFAAFLVYSVASIDKVNIEYSITAYLPSDTDTKKALDIMEDEFVTYGNSTILIRNITFEDANELAEEIRAIDGVKDLPFENTTDYYKKSNALFSITFVGDEDDELSVRAYDEVVDILSTRDIAISSKLVDTYADDLANDINKILLMVVAIIIVVLIFTSKSFAEVIVFLMIFGIAALLNMGTNYWFGTISFISNSVCAILQLALAIDYAIILSQRFAEEKETEPDPEKAMTEALSKAIPEIFGSSLTTIAGLLALTCMTLGLGKDLGFVLAKSIVFSILTVFLLMPGLMLLFTRAIDKTSHKSFVPKISFFGKGILKVRFLLPSLFLVGIVICAYYSFQVNYVYSQSSIDTPNPTESMVATREIKELFGGKNQFVILVPKDSKYAKEEKVCEIIKREDMIKDVTAISNVDLTKNGYTFGLTEQINYKDFANLLAIDQTTAKNIFLAYCYLQSDETNDGIKEVATFEANPDIYTTTILKMADCVFTYDDFISSYLNDNEDALETYKDTKETIEDAEDQLIGKNYTRIVFNIDGDIESPETFELIERLNTNVKGEVSGVIFAGDSMSSYDLNSSFSTDNILISILTIVFVYLILMFTTKTWGTPLLLVLTIQGAIFINFSINAISGTNLFFFVYLIVSSIQMGATIDYAIVITNRYQELVLTCDKKTAIIETLNQSFPTILTSGVILSSSGFLINVFVKDPLISTLGLALGRGTLISIASVMCVLPLLLYFFDKWFAKTKLPDFKQKYQDTIQSIKRSK